MGANCLREIFKQISLQQDNSLAYIAKLPGWGDSVSLAGDSVPSNSLSARLQLYHKMPPQMRALLCKGLLTLHPSRRVKVGAARSKLSTLKFGSSM